MAGELTVTAIIAAYNEDDIIGQVVGYLVEQGIRVHFLDDGSTDRTVAEVERHVPSGLVKIERLPDSGAVFRWRYILERKSALAAELESDWFIHHDADELRESPWPGINLLEGIRAVDALGYNAIDFEVFNFCPTDETYEPGQDVREAFPGYLPASPWDRVQIKCWKKVRGPLDLASSGGHEVLFPARTVFPLRFILRHYPVRGQAHGERKVFSERIPRYLEQELADGWHVQYDGHEDPHDFLHAPSSLTTFDPLAARIQLAIRHRGVEEAEQLLEEGRGRLAAESRRLEEQIVRLEQITVGLEVNLERAGEQVARLERENAGLQGQVSRLQEVERGLEERIAHQLEQTARLEHETRRLGHEGARLQSALDSQAAEAAHRAAQLRREAEAIRARLAAVLRSRSWRITAPLRAALALALGLGPGESSGR